MDDISKEEQVNFSEIEMQLLSKWTYNLAINIVPENLQCILMRLDREGQRYRIITGLPSDNRRHGIGEVGHLYEPVEKTALLEAVHTNEVVVMQQAKTDPRVRYMERHVLDKGIESIAILPIYYEKAVRWLIVIDKVPPVKPGFSDKEMDYLQKQKHWLESYELPVIRLSTTVNYGLTSLRGILDNYGHEIRNRLQPIGGYAHLIKKNIAVDNDKLSCYVEKIIHEVVRCENELAAFTKLIIHLYTTEDKKELIPVSELIDYFKTIPNMRYSDNAKEYQKIAIMNYKVTLDAVFSELARYIATTGIKNDETWLSLTQDDYTIGLVIQNRVFQDYKQDMDVRLSLFEHIIKKTGGNVAFGQGECLIRFPRD